MERKHSIYSWFLHSMQLSIENITEQVVVFTETLAVTLNNTMMQTPEVLNMSAEYFEGVAGVFRTSPGTIIPPMVRVCSILRINPYYQGTPIPPIVYMRDTSPNGKSDKASPSPQW